MSKMCPMDGCKARKGFCIHEMMMMGMAAVLMILALAHFGFGAFG